MVRSLNVLAAASAIAMLCAVSNAAQSQVMGIRAPCGPAPLVETDLANQGFTPVGAKLDGDGDVWITWEHKDGRWLLMLYMVEPKAQCFVARGGNWNVAPEMGA